MEIFNNFSNALSSRILGICNDRRVEELYLPISYTLECGGKRLRPMLCLLCAHTFTQHTNSAIEKAMSSALAIEIFHNFTLLHDDIMDSAPTRRGRATVYKKWNENRAILSGDAMMILSYEILQDATPLDRLLKIFNRAALEVCEGQQLDMDFQNSEQGVTIDEYIEMIRLKTAVLIAAAAQMGAVAAGAQESECEALYNFGLNLGLAFQIQDDLLDTYGNKETFGKEIGGDIAEGKQTFLKVTALYRASDEQKAILESSKDYNTVRRLYDELGVPEAASNQISVYFEKALSYLELLPNNENLIKFSNLLLNRNN
ncbi:MAG: polyprenyl synthetase family protein [Rikenellaceae bacterium]